MSKVFQALERVEGLRRRSAADVLAPRKRADGTSRPDSSDPAEYERLCAAILQARIAAPFKTMMVASPDHGEGGSTVAVGLAKALAARLRVVLVDANFRSPVLAERFHVEPALGLADVLSNLATVEAALTRTAIANLRLLGAGTATDQTFRQVRSGLPALIRQLAEASDVVIFDAPPVLPYADALILASQAERVVLVTHAERTQRGDLERAKDELERSGAAILGVVLNRKTSHAPPWLQRYLNL